jgi:hydrogenase expression/formation protein HypD
MTGTQLHQGRTTEENQYARVVPEDGNPVSLAAVADVYERRSSFEWRGLGEIDASGLKIRPKYRAFVAEKSSACAAARAPAPWPNQKAAPAVRS